MTTSFNIPYPATVSGKRAWNKTYGMNKYWSGCHWSIRKKDAEFWHSVVKAEMARQGVGAVPYTSPVIITMVFNDRLDSINHAAMFKMIEDAMKGTVIVDDSRKWVRGSEIYFHDKPYISVCVRESGKGEEKEHVQTEKCDCAKG